MKKILSLLLMLFTSLPALCQEVEMANDMRSNGKIYVVVAILLVILLGLVLYLVSIDRKATRLEKKLESRGKT